MLTSEHLQFGSVSLLAKVLELEASQLSAWFHSDRQITTANLLRISRAMNLTIDEVMQAIESRRSENQRRKQLNQEIETHLN